MSGDYSRDSFDALGDIAGVFLQQGRVTLDADWNEMVRVFERRIRAGTLDTVGRAVVPCETPSGFRIRVAAGAGLEIGRGRFYLHGLLLECHGAANYPRSGNADFPGPVFDRARQGTDGPEGVLDELISPEAGDFLPYASQPYWPTAEPLPEGPGPHLAYLVAWHREVTPVEDPDLLEPALGGIDTATRWQTVWQVRVLPDVGADATCATPDGLLEGWQAASAPSTARLSTATIDIEDPEDPCLIPPTDGYTGVENQLYRVELHSVGASQSDARFKFSRENASVRAQIESFASPPDRVTVRRIGRDEVLRFRAGDWVEITDDRRELDHRSGQMLRVVRVDEETRQIELDGAVAADLVPTGIDGDTPAARRSRMIRWDQRGVIRHSDGTAWVDLDDPASDGLIPVPADDRPIVLESGITVSFSTASGAGGFREMDHWRFAARTAGTQIEELGEAPPDGVQRHYTRLAVVAFPDSVQDCRIFWPPESESGPVHACGCTVCVTPESHNSGQLTIQAAIDRIGTEGGTVCLDGGGYEVRGPIRIAGRRAITLHGQGMATVLSYRGQGSAIGITGSIDVQIERLSVLVRPPDEDDTGGRPTAAAIAATNTAALALRRVAVLVVSRGRERQDHGIAIDGVAMGVKIEECVAVAPVALGSPFSRDTDLGGPSFLAVAEMRVLDSILLGARAAVRFEGNALNLGGAIFTRNLVFGTGAGMRVAWLEPPSGSTEVSSSTVLANGDGLRLGTGDLRLKDNDIRGGAETGDGIRLVPGLLREIESDAQIMSNRIGDLAGTGIRIEGRLGALLVERNLIRRCGLAGILTDSHAAIRHAAVDDNVIDDIADAPPDISAGAIVLTRVSGGRIAGNRISGVGQGGAPEQIYAGIAVQTAGLLAIQDNAIARIGPDSAAALAVGILCLSPYVGLSIRANRIMGAPERTEAEGRGWIAIQLGGAGIEWDGDESGIVSFARTVPGMTPSDVAFAEARGRTFMLTRASIADVGPVAARQLTIGANMVRHSGRVGLPLVLVVDPVDASVVFSENQTEQLEGGGGSAPQVLISAPRMVVSNNVVRHDADAQSMLLDLGANGVSTVLGNLTSGGITVVPGGLQPPFDALNVFA